jgi:Ni/Co efflux regulator RcnB
MKLLLLSLFAIVFSASSFAQHRGGGRIETRNDRHDDRRDDRRDNRRDDRRDDRRDYRSDNRGGVRVIITGPRYNPNRYSSRVIRSTRRAPIYWENFGYTCDTAGGLRLNGRLVHDFSFGAQCFEALSDIQVYGDFCDYEDLYDQTGIQEAQFESSAECRNALGWYY